jgi:hypothetical protein
MVMVLVHPCDLVAALAHHDTETIATKTPPLIRVPPVIWRSART